MIQGPKEDIFEIKISPELEMIHRKLLEKVFQGQFSEFKHHFSQEGNRFLHVFLEAELSDLRLLSQALQGTLVNYIRICGLKTKAAKLMALDLRRTSVKYVNLRLNGISNEAAALFATKLKNTAVTHLNLAFNEIDDKGATTLIRNLAQTNVNFLYLEGNEIPFLIDIINLIPNTSLIFLKLSISLCRMDRETKLKLDAALLINKNRLLITPYNLWCLMKLPEAERNKHFNLPLEALSSSEGQLRYAGGILANHKLPSELRAVIIQGVFPLYSQSKATKNMLTFARFHPKSLLLEEKKESVKPAPAPSPKKQSGCLIS